MRPFNFVDKQNPFYIHVQTFNRKLHEIPMFKKIQQMFPSAKNLQIRSSMKGHLQKNDKWSLKYIQVSLQFRDIREHPSFCAVTFFYSAKTGEIEYFELLDDPYLQGARAFFNANQGRKCKYQNDKDFDVIRYVPRHRMVFQTSMLGDGPVPITVIGKCARKIDIERSYAMLTHVSDAVKPSLSGYSVATPMGLEPEYSLFFQQYIKSKNLSCIVNECNEKNIFYTLGHINRSIHTLNVTCANEWDISIFFQSVVSNVKWVIFFYPEYECVLSEVFELLLSRMPKMNIRENTFCHGDFRCSNVLKEGDRWSIIDFDGGGYGDPYLELARLTSSLKRTLIRGRIPKNNEEEVRIINAEESFLRGYQDRAKKNLNRERLLWYRICREIHILAMIIRKDKLTQTVFDYILKFILTLSRKIES